MAEWTGPSTGEMIRTHTLAIEIIRRHNDDWPVLDASELELLRRFCSDPSTKYDILSDLDILDEPGDVPGTANQERLGSLVAHAIACHDTENPVFLQRDITMLKEWFDSGAVDDAV